MTAQRRQENVQDVPMSIAAITSQDLSTAGASGLGDLKIVVPSLSVDSAAGFLLVHLRGVGSIATGAGIENPVALYVDGVYRANQSAGAAQFNNIARIEVLKGPQGTLFGRNTTGGLVHVISEDPDGAFRLGGRISYGNYNAIEGNLYASGPVSSDLAADFAVRFGSHDGYGRNLLGGKDVLKVAHDVAMRSKVIYQPRDFKFTFIADYSDKTDSANALTVVEGSMFFPSRPPVSYPDRWDVRNDQLPHLHSRETGLSLKAETAIGALQIINLAAYRAAKMDNIFDYDGTEFPLVAADIKLRDTQFSNELQLRSDDHGKLSWIAGIYYFDARSKLDPQTVSLSTDPRFNPDLPLTALITSGSQDTRSSAVFGQMTITLSEQVRITGGARHTSERRSMESRIDGFLLLPGRPQIPVFPATSRSKTFGQPTFRAAIDFKPIAQAMIYASVSTGFKSGGFNVAEPQSPFFRSEKLTAYEIGEKVTLSGGKLRINSAFFHYDYRHLQVLRAGQTSIGFSSGPSARITGFDADMIVIPLPGFELTAGLALLRATYGNFPDALLGALGGGVPVAVGDASGNRVPFSPKSTVSLGATYSRQVGNQRIVFNAGFLHSSKSYFEPDNVIVQPAYGLWNAMGRYEFHGGRRWLSIYGRNLSNDAVRRAALTLPSGQQINILGPPRTFGVEFGMRY